LDVDFCELYIVAVSCKRYPPSLPYLENPPLQKERSQVETQEIIAVESKDRRFTKRLPFHFSSPSFLVAAAPLHGFKLEPALKEMLQGRTKWKLRSK
jgi:hypothetical protein